MIALGYNEYGTSLLPSSPIFDLLISLAVTQGGDWGFLVSEVSQVDGIYCLHTLRSLGEWPPSMVENITRRGTPTFRCMCHFRSLLAIIPSHL